MVRTIIQLTDEQAEGLKRLAGERGKSMAALVREAVDAVLTRERRQRDDRVERALALIGAGSSAPRDLAQRHDDHIADAIEAELAEMRG